MCSATKLSQSLTLTLVLVAPILSVPTSQYGHPPPPPYGHPKPEYPKQNCTVETVKEDAETCTPTFTTVCEDVTIPVKNIVDREQCYPVTKTVCSESVSVVANEICVYEYGPKEVDTTAKTVSVVYSTPCTVQMVTVCDPGHQAYGYGHEVHCKEVEQETCYNEPALVDDIQPQSVIFPEPAEVCVQKPINLVVVTCEDIVTEKCITVPEVEDGVEVLQVCKPQLGEPDCQDIVLELPKERCIEIVYGYAHGYGEAHHASPY
jgi:hypothetical protein